MSKLGKDGHKRHFWKSLSHKKTKSCIVSSLAKKEMRKRGKGGRGLTVNFGSHF